MGYFCNFPVIVHSKESPIGRKFAQSGHSDYRQGDQSGRIFAYRANYFFGHIFDNYSRSLNFWDTFSTEKGMYV
jgi:hypothetical protein